MGSYFSSYKKDVKNILPMYINKILIVSYSKRIKESIQTYLYYTSLPIQIYNVNTFGACLQKIDDHIGINLIILDTSMLHINQYKLIEELRTNSNYNKLILAVLPFRNTSKIEKYLKAGANDILSSDFSYLDFKTCIHNNGYDI